MILSNYLELKEYVTGATIDELAYMSLKSFLEQNTSQRYDNASFDEISNKVKSLPLYFSAGIMNYKNNYDYLIDKIRDLKNNFNRYEELYDNVFTETKSKEVLFNVLNYRITYDIHEMNKIYDILNQYFDPDLVAFSEEDVYVDCGGYNGDSVCEFILNNPNYRHIYVYEPFEKNASFISNLIEKIVYDNSVTVKKAATYSESTTLNFELTEDDIQNRVSKNGSVKINAVKLDEDIKEKITFIKMDIEGSELDTLRGSIDHIKKDNPILALSLYHRFTDLYEITNFIMSINSKYTFFLRQYTFAEADTVLYCIPKDLNRFESEYRIKNDRYFRESFNICKRSVEPRILKHSKYFIQATCAYNRLFKQYFNENESYRKLNLELTDENHKYESSCSELQQEKAKYESLCSELQKENAKYKEECAQQTEEIKNLKEYISYILKRAFLFNFFLKLRKKIKGESK